LAAVFCLVVAGLIWWRTDGGPTYSTATGEQRTLKLEDGSIIYLNTRSSVRVSYSSNARDINLQTGEALFSVAHDPARPFRVFAGDIVVRAVGTQFNVLRRPDETRVALVEGKVRVSTSPETLAGTSADAPGSIQLSAGEQATVLSDGKVHTHVADPESSTAWRQRRLVFRDTELSEIAAEFNRYNRRPRFRVVGEAVAQRRLYWNFQRR
jgi:transmembrane sensor